MILAAMKCAGVSVFRSGRGHMRGCGGGDHIMLGVCCGAMGGPVAVGVEQGLDALSGMLVCGGVSGSRPRS